MIEFNEKETADIRNYSMAAGFLALFIWHMCNLIADLSGDSTFYNVKGDGMIVICLCSSILVIAATVLALAHKRDQVSVMFIFFVCMSVILTQVGSGTSLVVDLMFFVMGAIFLLSGNEQRYITATLCFIGGCYAFSTVINELWAFAVMDALMSVVTLYCALCIVSERKKLPLYDMLTADEAVPENDGVPVHFKICGSSVGYIMIGLIALLFACANLFPESVSFEECKMVEIVSMPLFVILGLIMLTAGRMRFTPFFFIAFGIINFIGSTITEMTIIGAIGGLVLGLMLLMRNDRKILPAIISILFGLIYLMLFIQIQYSVDLFYPNVITDLVVTVLCIYTSAALFSQNRLKLV